MLASTPHPRWRDDLKTREIPTPALIVDVDALSHNLQRMAAFFEGRNCKLRPHFKAHKTPEILSRQIEAGNCTGATCATAHEASVCARHGVEEILIANEPIGKASRCAEIASTTRLIVAADSEFGLRELSAAASGRGVRIGILIDINVGMPRCGVRPENAVELVALCSSLPGLEFRGLMGYEGHAVLIKDFETRNATAQRGMQTLLEAKHLVEEAGFPVEIVSGGGTGTYNISGNIEGITEIQAGSYALMDDAYLELALGFERAAYVLATVISRPSDHLAIADAGLKTFSMDHGNPNVISTRADVIFLSDEHASLRAESNTLPIGSRVKLSIAHIDPTVNLHSEFWATSNDEVVDRWPIEARGYGN